MNVKQSQQQQQQQQHYIVIIIIIIIAAHCLITGLLPYEKMQKVIVLPRIVWYIVKSNSHHNYTTNDNEIFSSTHTHTHTHTHMLRGKKRMIDTSSFIRVFSDEQRQHFAGVMVAASADALFIFRGQKARAAFLSLWCWW
jgi:hypothetical protein